MDSKKGDTERKTVTREAFRQDVNKVSLQARREGGVIVTDAQGHARFLVSTPADKWPTSPKKS